MREMQRHVKESSRIELHIDKTKESLFEELAAAPNALESAINWVIFGHKGQQIVSIIFDVQIEQFVGNLLG